MIIIKWEKKRLKLSVQIFISRASVRPTCLKGKSLKRVA